MRCDLKDHFLASSMQNPHYMRIKWGHISKDIKIRYNLQSLLHNGYVYVKIKKGIYGLKGSCHSGLQKVTTASRITGLLSNSWYFWFMETQN